MNTLTSETKRDVDVAHDGQMVRVPTGEFVMGCDEGEAEKPAHSVVLDEFWIDAAPVTNAEFSRFIRESGYVTTATAARRQDWSSYARIERQRHPVVQVSWHDAAAYAQWAEKRLPTEAEWEKAARGGLVGQLFPWGDALPSAELVNWNRVCEDGAELPTTAVASFPPNAYGIYDMAGNVWEWCNDWYDDNAYASAERVNPSGPVTGTYRVRRGASWNVREAFRLRCANRGAMPPESYHPNLGFRCARSSGEQKWTRMQK
jgi:formylglycine-generating enzyme